VALEIMEGYSFVLKKHGIKSVAGDTRKNRKTA